MITSPMVAASFQMLEVKIFVENFSAGAVDVVTRIFPLNATIGTSPKKYFSSIFPIRVAC